MPRSISARRTVGKDRHVWPIPNFFSIWREACDRTSKRARKYRRRWDAAARDYFFSYPPSDIHSREEAQFAWDNMSIADRKVVDQDRLHLIEYDKWGDIAVNTPDGAFLKVAPAPHLLQLWNLPAFNVQTSPMPGVGELV